MTAGLEPLWCAHCGRRVMAHPDSARFSRQLPECCGDRAWIETEPAIRAAAHRVDSRVDVCHWADEFRRFPDVETARKLRDAVDLYLQLHNAPEEGDE